MKIGFIVDSAADITKDMQEKYDIKVIPLCPTVDDVTYTPGVDVTNEEYYDILINSKEFPTTSQPPREVVADAFREMLEKYDTVIYVTISSLGSETYNVACMAAKEFIDNGADLTVFDSLQYCVAIGVPVVNAAKKRDEGASKEEILEYLQTATRRDLPYFLVDDMTQLKRGGRIKASKVVIANLLDIKPILWAHEGLTQVMDKVRGSKKSVAKLVDIMIERGDNLAEEEVVVMHARGGEKLELLLKLIDEKVSPKSVKVYEIGPTIVTHSGLGVTGIYFKHKEGSW